MNDVPRAPPRRKIGIRIFNKLRGCAKINGPQTCQNLMMRGIKAKPASAPLGRGLAGCHTAWTTMRGIPPRGGAPVSRTTYSSAMPIGDTHRRYASAMRIRDTHRRHASAICIRDSHLRPASADRTCDASLIVRDAYLWTSLDLLDLSDLLDLLDLFSTSSRPPDLLDLSDLFYLLTSCTSVPRRSS